MIDKNLFLYDLAVTAIFKDEALYLKEWLDYHLLAGVEHFYLYNNDSSDNCKEVLAPYIEKNLVTLIDFPGKVMQIPAYIDALQRFRFFCRYMAFIDLDEFIFPKSNRSIVEVVDEILSGMPNAAGLAINWQCFGSNGQETADYSRGVLERFTRRASSGWFIPYTEKTPPAGNLHVKTIANPRLVNYISNPHFAYYFKDKIAVNSAGEQVRYWSNVPILFDKIVINHYHVKSREEYSIKVNRGSACHSHNVKKMEFFLVNDRNEVFDDGILNYRAARAENFSFENDDQRFDRVIDALVRTLAQSEKSFVGKTETFLVCRAVAEKLQLKIGNTFAEEIALTKIYQALNKKSSITELDVRLLIKALPEILARPFPVCKEIKQSVQDVIIPQFIDILKADYFTNWIEHYELDYIQKLLRFIK